MIVADQGSGRVRSRRMNGHPSHHSAAVGDRCLAVGIGVVAVAVADGVVVVAYDGWRWVGCSSDGVLRHPNRWHPSCDVS